MGVNRVDSEQTMILTFLKKSHFENLCLHDFILIMFFLSMISAGKN